MENAQRHTQENKYARVTHSVQLREHELKAHNNTTFHLLSQVGIRSACHFQRNGKELLLNRIKGAHNTRTAGSHWVPFCIFSNEQYYFRFD